MVISIQPRSRSEFNDLATLSISHSKGKVETPNRLVNRHDLNAKNAIGADIPLTRTSKTFILQEIVNSKKLENILNINGYLNQVFLRLRVYPKNR